MKDKSPLCLAGLWDEWLDKETGKLIKTVAIVTTSANQMMTKIHNNPKLAEPRMPVILPRNLQDDWLIPCLNENHKKHLLALLKPFNTELLNYKTVGKLKGKHAIGDVAEAEYEFVYEELML
jgi:putative SOS response-associated peptidase YedK